MKYVSIDIETTGLDRERCQIIEFGAIIEDTNNLKPLADLPALRVLVRHPELYWEDNARNMHQELMKDFEVPGALVLSSADLVKAFKGFLLLHGFPEKEGRVRLNVAGKNFAGFDREFLDQVPGWKQAFSISRRVLDPAMLYVDFKNDNELPDLKECKKRAGLTDQEVKHEALADALDVVAVLRKKYN